MLSLVQRIDPTEDVHDAWITHHGYSVECRNSLDDPNILRIAIAISSKHFNYMFLRYLYRDRYAPDSIVRIRGQNLITRCTCTNVGTVIEWHIKQDAFLTWSVIEYIVMRASLDLAMYQQYHTTPPEFRYCPQPVRAVNSVYAPIHVLEDLEGAPGGMNFHYSPDDLPPGPPPLVRQVALPDLARGDPYRYGRNLLLEIRSEMHNST